MEAGNESITLISDKLEKVGEVLSKVVVDEVWDFEGELLSKIEELTKKQNLFK